MKNIRLICILIAIPALLLVPYLAMRYTNEVVWTPIDFLTMGVMLLITGLAIEAWDPLESTCRHASLSIL